MAYKIHNGTFLDSVMRKLIAEKSYSIYRRLDKSPKDFFDKCELADLFYSVKFMNYRDKNEDLVL